MCIKLHWTPAPHLDLPCGVVHHRLRLHEQRFQAGALRKSRRFFLCQAPDLARNVERQAGGERRLEICGRKQKKAWPHVCACKERTDGSAAGHNK